MQFTETESARGKCVICGKEVVIRNTRKPNLYCSRVCESMKRYSTRYKGSSSGPMDRPKSMIEKTMLP